MKYDITLQLMTGVDIAMPELALTIHQPRVKEIAMMGEECYYMASHLICINKDSYFKDKSMSEKISNFQIFMKLVNENAMPNQEDIKGKIQNLFSLLFQSASVNFTPQSLLIKSQGSEFVIIDENNFDILQEYCQEIFCLGGNSSDAPKYNPQGKKAQEIYEKIMEGRRKVAQEKGEGAFKSILSRYLSILTVALPSMSLQNCCDLTMFQVHDLMERYSLHTSWDLDIRARMAGAKSDNKPEEWTKDIH